MTLKPKKTLDREYINFIKTHDHGNWYAYKLDLPDTEHWEVVDFEFNYPKSHLPHYENSQTIEFEIEIKSVEATIKPSSQKPEIKLSIKQVYKYEKDNKGFKVDLKKLLEENNIHDYVGIKISFKTLKLQAKATATRADIPLELPEAKENKLDTDIYSVNIFFDGTGNNGINANSLIEKYNKDPNYSKTKKDKGSFESSFTNIYRLYENSVADGHKKHKESLENVDINKPFFQFASSAYIYVSGIGTQNDKNENWLDTLVQGLGDIVLCEQLFDRLDGKKDSEKSSFYSIYNSLIHGAGSKIEEANKAIKAIKGTTGKRVQINIFGFSRGAALARYYANKLNKNKVEAFSPNFRPKSVEINFLGLFDTVESIICQKGIECVHGADGIVETYNPQIEGVANYCYHLTANHEARHTFPLTSILDLKDVQTQRRSEEDKADKTSLDKITHTTNKALYASDEIVALYNGKNKKRLEIHLSGTHADIGGGYLTNLTQRQSLSDYLKPDALERRIEWFEKNQKWNSVIYKYLQRSKDKDYLVLEKENVDARLQYVYLYMMAQAANSQGCSFNLRSIEDEYVVFLSPTLKKYLHHLSLLNEASIKGEKIEKSDTFNPDMLKDIGKFIHVSFAYDSIINPAKVKPTKDQSDSKRPIKSSFGGVFSTDPNKVELGAAPAKNQKVIDEIDDKAIKFGRVYQPSETLIREMRYYDDKITQEITDEKIA